MRRKLVRVGTAVAFTGLVLAFVLSWKLGDPGPFTVVAPVAIGGKWWENYAQRRWGEHRQVDDEASS